MTNDEIRILFQNSQKKGNHKIHFNALSVKELCEIMNFCEELFRSKKNNWSIKKMQEFCANNNISSFSLTFTLSHFYLQYRKRKKTNRGFEMYLGVLLNHHKTSGLMKPLNKRIALSNKRRLKEFLEEMKTLKTQYLTCTDDMLLEMLSKHIKTGFTKSSLRDLYYKQVNKSEK